MTPEEAEEIVSRIWAASGMEDNSGTDRVRDELEAALLAAYERGVADARGR